MLFSLVAALALAAVVFAGMWLLCQQLRNYGFLDVTWTYMIGVLATLAALVGNAPPSRMWVPLAGLLWSLRLGTFVLRRVVRHHPQEDKRYRTLRTRWPTPLAFLLFFELQAAIAVVFAVPFLLAARESQTAGPVQWLGLVIAVLGVCGEALADAQASAFKHRATPGVPILDSGLWRYSRHPNYFFELLFWIGIAVSVLDLSWGWTALACPVLIGYFLLGVTGVPLTEQHSLESHGEAYRDYQRRTSVLVPWFPKGSSGGRPTGA